MLLSVFICGTGICTISNNVDWCRPNRIMSLTALHRAFAQPTLLGRFTTAYNLEARFDEESGKPYRMWGAGIEFNTASEATLYSELLPFLDLTGLASSCGNPPLERTTCRSVYFNPNKLKPCRPRLE